MKRDLILLIVFSIVALSLVISVGAFKSKSYSYRLTDFVTEGGNTSSSSSYISTLSFAQPVIGWTTGENYNICLGIYCTETFNPPYDVKIDGQLFYDNGSYVSNSDVRTVISYKDYKYENISRTDNTGNFIANINSLPEFMRYRNFNVKIYVSGEVDALHECTYNTEDEHCY